MKTKQILAGALACSMLALALTGCGKKDDGSAETPKPTGTAVEVQTVETGAMAAETSVTGTVAAATAVQVFPMLAGTVTALNVQEGDTVTQGQVLFQVDTATVTSTYGALQNSYNATKAATDEAIASAQLGVQQAQIAVDQATTQLENVQAMHEIGAASDQQLTTAQQGVQQAEAALRQAQAGVQQAQASQQASLAQIQASLSQIQSQADLGTVTAPVSGLVTAVNLERGGMAAQSMPSVVIAEDSNIEVQIAVSETVYAGIHVGDTASVTMPTVSTDAVTAAITSIAAAANQQTKLYDVKLSLPADVRPPIGAFADVKLYTDRRDSTVFVPTDAILTDGDNQYVFVLTDEAPAAQTDGEGDSFAAASSAAPVDENVRAAKKIIVTTGLVGEENTEITSGLTGGETLVVKGQSYLSDGAAARIVSGKDDVVSTNDGASSGEADA